MNVADLRRRCSTEHVRSNRLQTALRSLTESIREVDAALEETRAAHDPLALHIFTSRREYRTMQDTKSGKRHAVAARLGWQRACELGFRGSVHEWDRLMGAAPPR